MPSRRQGAAPNLHLSVGRHTYRSCRHQTAALVGIFNDVQQTGWRYQITATNMRHMWGIAGSHQVQFLDALHRDHAEVEDRIRTNKAMGLHNLPSASWQINTAWMLAANLAADLNAWLRLLTLHDQDDLTDAESDTMRVRLYHLPARLAHHARRRWLRIETTWPWASAFTTCWERLIDLSGRQVDWREQLGTAISPEDTFEVACLPFVTIGLCHHGVIAINVAEQSSAPFPSHKRHGLRDAPTFRIGEGDDNVARFPRIVHESPPVALSICCGLPCRLEGVVGGRKIGRFVRVGGELTEEAERAGASAVRALKRTRIRGSRRRASEGSNCERCRNHCGSDQLTGLHCLLLFLFEASSTKPGLDPSLETECS